MLFWKFISLLGVKSGTCRPSDGF